MGKTFVFFKLQIHGISDYTAVPLVYALLCNKTQKTYCSLLAKIKALVPEIFLICEKLWCS